MFYITGSINPILLVSMSVNNYRLDKIWNYFVIIKLKCSSVRVKRMTKNITNLGENGESLELRLNTFTAIV
jgi:hypothetical protein